MMALRYFIALSVGALVTAQTDPAADIWQPLRFLEGKWVGEVSGQPGKGKSEREYRFVLKGKFLAVHNKSTYAAQSRNPKGEIHEDQGIISYDRARKKFVFRQFHVEGFVNQYVGEVESERIVRFQSESIENIPAGFRARETYTAHGPNAFVERFELAEPGKEYEVYSETRFERKRE